MIKCKQALNGGAACGKEICCLECEKKEGCEDVCTYLKADCEDAIQEENALSALKNDKADVIKAVASLAIQKKVIEEQEKAMRVQLVAAMEKYGVKSLDTPDVKITYIAPTTRTSIDSTKLKKDLPGVAAKYSKTSNVSASVKIEVRG